MSFEPKIGDTLIDNTTGQSFVVLCSCPGSMPRRHTLRYVKANMGEFSRPPHPAASSTPSVTPTTPPQTQGAS